jgi:hypothetical protein
MEMSMSMTEQLPNGEITGSHVKIGAKSNTGRTMMWIVGAVVAVGGMGAFYMMSGSSNEPKLKALEDFRGAFAAKCNNPEFSTPASQFLKDQFLNSSLLQDAVTKQATALQGGASCADVEQALKAASFPLAAHSHG